MLHCSACLLLPLAACISHSVVRLVVHWSRLEPERGHIDMHQDAYSAFIYTPESETCPEDAWPGNSWDGAPEWATLTDGPSACVTGDRDSAPAVAAAKDDYAIGVEPR